MPSGVKDIQLLELAHSMTWNGSTQRLAFGQYAFLAVNNLHYNIGIAELWYQKIESLVGSSYHAWSRIINLFDLYIQRQKFDPLKKYSFRKARDWKYPLWCSLAVNAYLDWLRRSFHSEGTIRSYKYVVYNFCDFLLLKKLNSFEDLNRNLINEFLRIDLHSTVNGTSGRNSVLRQFITFLEDNDSESPMALVLVGQSELWEEKLRLKRYAAVRQRIDINCVLPHLDRAE